MTLGQSRPVDINVTNHLLSLNQQAVPGIQRLNGHLVQSLSVPTPDQEVIWIYRIGR